MLFSHELDTWQWCRLERHRRAGSIRIGRVEVRVVELREGTHGDKRGAEEVAAKEFGRHHLRASVPDCSYHGGSEDRPNQQPFKLGTPHGVRRCCWR